MPRFADGVRRRWSNLVRRLGGYGRALADVAASLQGRVSRIAATAMPRLADGVRRRWSNLVCRLRGHGWALAGVAASLQGRVFRVRQRLPTSAVLTVVATVGILAALSVVAAVTPPLGWLPAAAETASLLGALLGAQAAIAALTLAVTIFVLQGVSNRDDADDRMYQEYVRRSWVQSVFWGSLIAVGVTGVVLLAAKFISGADAVLAAMPGVRNLTLAAALALFANLSLAGTLFQQALRLSQPTQWRALRLRVNREDVRAAIHRYVQGRLPERTGRSGNAIAGDNSELGSTRGSANEAIRALLDDAQRAMDQRRLADFTGSLQAVEELVAYAMSEIDGAGIPWGLPGAPPDWPPLRELDRNLYSLRRQIIQQGDEDYMAALRQFDYFLLSSGMRRQCGELFTVALQGYRYNHEIARSISGGASRDVFRDRLWTVVDGLVLEMPADQLQPYLDQMVRHQERLLHEAIQAERPSDYEQLHRGFRRVLRAVWLHRDIGRRARDEPGGLYQQLLRDYRVSLMGLGGRAMFLSESGRLADSRPYLDLVRGEFTDLSQLADDTVEALARDGEWGSSLWFEWEVENAESFGFQSVDPGRYPLAFFVVRLAELSNDSMPLLNLQGRAQRVLGWFERHSKELESYIRVDPERSNTERHASALEALHASVRRDGLAEDQDIILRELSNERVSGFIASVYAGAFSSNGVERLFRRSDAFLYLASDASGAPEERGFLRLQQKAFLADVPESADTYYAPLEGDEWGWGLSEDVVHQLCEILDEARTTPEPLDSPQALLQAIDMAKESLGPSGDLVVVLAGNWSDTLLELSAQGPHGFEAAWRISQEEQVGETARYHGIPILEGPAEGERRVLVVEPGSWGCFVRAQVEGEQDLHVEANLISAERAQVLLSSDPNYFADEPDEAAKLRKLQTCAEVVVGARAGFRVADPSRALRVVDSS